MTIYSGLPRIVHIYACCLSVIVYFNPLTLKNILAWMINYLAILGTGLSDLVNWKDNQQVRGKDEAKIPFLVALEVGGAPDINTR